MVNKAASLGAASPHDTAMKDKTSRKDAAANKEWAPAQREALLGVLEARFVKHMNRHEGLSWAAVKARLEAHPGKLPQHPRCNYVKICTAKAIEPVFSG